MSDKKSNPTVKYYVCDYWGKEPLYIIKTSGGVICNDMPYASYETYRGVCERWIGRSIKVLFRYASLHKPRFYVYPESWVANIEIQRIIATLKVVRNRLIAARQDTLKNINTISLLDQEKVVLEDSLKASLLRFFLSHS